MVIKNDHRKLKILIRMRGSEGKQMYLWPTPGGNEGMTHGLSGVEGTKW